MKSGGQARRSARIYLSTTIIAVAAMLVAGFVSVNAPAYAADETEVTLSIKDHKFEPAEVRVPAGKAIKLTVKNLDATPEEFESKSLKIEKVIAGKGTAVIRLKPLSKGTHKFFGEYHEKTAQGVLIAE